MRRICGVSVLTLIVFLIFILFASIAMMGFFLPDVPFDEFDTYDPATSSSSSDVGSSAQSNRNKLSSLFPAIFSSSSNRTSSKFSSKYRLLTDPPTLPPPNGPLTVDQMSLVWDFGACGCTGWGIEAINFVVPLFRRIPHLGIVSGADCFCPGQSTASLASLNRMRHIAEELADLTRRPKTHQVMAERHHDPSIIFVPRPKARKRKLATPSPLPQAEVTEASFKSSASTKFSILHHHKHFPHAQYNLSKPLHQQRLGNSDDDDETMHASIDSIHQQSPGDELILTRRKGKRIASAKSKRANLITQSVRVYEDDGDETHLRTQQRPVASASPTPTAAKASIISFSQLRDALWSRAHAGRFSSSGASTQRSNRKSRLGRLLRPPVPPQEPLHPWQPRAVDVWVSHKPPSRFPRWPYHGLVQFEVRPRYVIGRSMSEVDRITQQWVDACHIMVDELWLPSSHLVHAFTSAGVNASRVTIRIVPEAVDTRALAPLAHREYAATLPVPETTDVLTADALGISNLSLTSSETTTEIHRRFPWSNLEPCRSDDFIFLSVFKWEKRKGWDVLLKAYFNEFYATPVNPSSGYHPNVCLVIKTYLFGSPDPYNIRHIRQIVEDYAINELGLEVDKLPRVAIVSKELTMADMASLYRRAHAFVLPTRGEGWGLPILEAMVAGVPVLVTEWSGHLDFATSERAFLIPLSGMSDAEGRDFAPGQKWAEPDAAYLRKLMRLVATPYDIDLTDIGSDSSMTIAHQQPVAFQEPPTTEETEDELHRDPENHMRFQRLAPKVRERAARAQREVVAQYNLDAVADIVLRRLTEIGSNLKENNVPWPSSSSASLKTSASSSSSSMSVDASIKSQRSSRR